MMDAKKRAPSDVPTSSKKARDSKRCFICKSDEHLIAECPKNTNKEKFVKKEKIELTMSDDPKGANLLKCIDTLSGAKVLVLFDPGASHDLVSQKLLDASHNKHLKAKVKPLTVAMDCYIICIGSTMKSAHQDLKKTKRKSKADREIDFLEK
ncbi:hypothetical protein SeLEV6574_g08470 [Synchytrium endobioticum]|uniref:CCHC-type domain-containing protein n=1 Tax=Synchytrium endobioticum TaxID=286115 RepID=A0A507C467_9FUNG|nr:hypothetical protein SeLEV6574_g08470 [Synchytrium endobioticum]